MFVKRLQHQINSLFSSTTGGSFERNLLSRLVLHCGPDIIGLNFRSVGLTCMYSEFCVFTSSSVILLLL